MDSWYRHGINSDSWYTHGDMEYIWTHGIDNTHGTDSDSWYSINTPSSHTYERAKCCPYTGFFVTLPKAVNFFFKTFSKRMAKNHKGSGI